MIQTINRPVVKSPEVATNKWKMTIVQFLDCDSEEMVEKPLPAGFTRVQDFLDFLNEECGYNLAVLGWNYVYYDDNNF
jgi:hypothetical protein